ncbi:GDSL-type esterase/lipase family protein [Paenibacillus chondroitinus]|uniref:GDSL-type esterase/lipase family protein n=1 Tax=Paenibacillus chondroitinus TaxID=59842 RepID=A0ABU6D9I0_9BACL|nr:MULTISPECIES: GDSL-type esterase/lipase family protein [Paenibacillus]MCY9656751.1 GDSL-type esterase/lipase family protein [Paenibacillus anseongense]MEB4794400.1 GDSL-type esterase/lipase family protein [Paenibacillus chondroitinus]
MTKDKRILFLGDSITAEGTFIAFLEAILLQHFPGQGFTLINIGVPSETASGLTEGDHPFPRPCVHERIERALLITKPDWVVLGYGMNDGIYSPFSQERFLAYQKGLLEAVRIVHSSGAKAIVMTPPAFDSSAIRQETLLADGHHEQAYSYLTPYEHYNDVLKTYARWLLWQEGIADEVVNIYDPLLQARENARMNDPDYRSGDGIHPHADGHWVIAETLLRHLFEVRCKATPPFVGQPESSTFFQLVWQRQKVLSAAWKEHIGHSNPNKATALPLEEALQEGDKLAEQIKNHFSIS